MHALAARCVSITSYCRLGLLSGLMAVGMATCLVSPASAYCTPDQCDLCELNDSCTRCCHEAPELWLVNTRHLPKCDQLDSGFERLSVKRWDASCRRWVRESYQAFLASEAANPLPTIIHSHGNTLKHEKAMDQCWLVYNKLKCCPGKKRLVFWSWPSQIAFKRPILRPRKLIEKNLKAKFTYSEHQGYYLAKFAQGMSFNDRVTFSGHSYGGIMASAAAHYLGGGVLRGRALEGGAPVERQNLRVVLISSAFDNNALDPGGRYGQAFVAAEKILVTRNSQDKTLKDWHKVSMCGRDAIGLTGVNANRLGPYRSKLCQITMTRDVGRSHYIKPHLSSGRLVNLLCCMCGSANGGCTATASVEEEAMTSAGPTSEQATEIAQPTVPAETLKKEAGDDYAAYDQGANINLWSRRAVVTASPKSAELLAAR